METPLLYSKLVAPQLRPNVVTRARLLERQPEAVQTFLLQNSILDKFCPALCDALRDPEAAPLNPPSDAAALLDRLEPYA